MGSMQVEANAIVMSYFGWVAADQGAETDMRVLEKQRREPMAHFRCSDLNDGKAFRYS